MVGKFYFAQTSVMGTVGRVALRPSFDSAMRWGGKVGPRAIWSLNGRLQKLPSIAPRALDLSGAQADVRIYSDAQVTDGGLAAVARFLQNFFVLLKGDTRDALIRAPAATDRIFRP